jgi:hypothetical protein
MDRSSAASSMVSNMGVLVSNMVILLLIYGIFQDYAYRLSYWRSLGFAPSTSYSPFFFVTSAAKGSTYIPGQLTLDWAQVLILILVAMDALYVYGVVRRRQKRGMNGKD